MFHHLFVIVPSIGGDLIRLEEMTRVNFSQISHRGVRVTRYEILLGIILSIILLELIF